MVIQHNISAMNADRMFGIVDKDKRKSAEKLSSGYRINRAADDAAGLSMSEKMRRQIRGLTQASANAQDGVSMVQTAEGALNEVHDMLQRMNELCVKAGNGTLTYDDRGYIQQEIYQLIDEIDHTGRSTMFNDIKIFDGLQQDIPTSILPGGTVNGAQGTITQGTRTSDASYTMNKIQTGNIAFIPAHGDEPDTYFRASTEEEIEEYKRSEGSAGFVERDGTTSQTAKLVNAEDFRREVALDLARTNLGANLDVAESIGYAFRDKQDKTEFFLHYYGPLQVTLQVGSESDHTYTFEIPPLNASRLGVLDVNVKDSDGAGALSGIEKVKNAIAKNSLDRANLGAVQNRLEHITKNLDNVVENTTASESKLRDTDMASEMQYYSNTDIIAQAGQTLLAQANQSKQGVLNLLQ